jgi:Tfp pilus assembly protein PilE
MISVLAETDANTMILQVTTLICGMLTTIVGAYISYKMSQLKTQQELAATKVQEVKSTLEGVTAAQNEKLETAVSAVQDVKQVLHESNQTRDDKLDKIVSESELGRKLADGVMTAQLDINRAALQKIADITKLPEDIEASLKACEIYENHASRQRSSS